MKKIVFSLAILFVGATSLTSCRETTESETIVKEVKVETEAAAEETGGILQRAGEAADKEVNKEIDNAIDEIGDDN